MKKYYKTIKLTQEEIKDIKLIIAQAILDLKTKEGTFEDNLYLKNKIVKYKKLLNYFSYIER